MRYAPSRRAASFLVAVLVLATVSITVLALVLGLAAPPRARAAEGPFSLVVSTFFCGYGEAPSQAQLEADENHCPGAVRPEDYPTLPDGYWTELQKGNLSYRVTTADSTIHRSSEFSLDGGGYCYQDTLTCFYQYGYQVDSLTGGVATLEMPTWPEWQDRLEAAFTTPGTDPPIFEPALTTDEAGRTVTFRINQNTCPDNNRCNLWVFLFQFDLIGATGTPSPSVGFIDYGGTGTPSPRAPNTSAGRPPDGTGSLDWLMQLLGVAFVVSGVGLAFRYRARGARRFP